MTEHNMKYLRDVVIFIWVFIAPLLAGPIDKDPVERPATVRSQKLLLHMMISSKFIDLKVIKSFRLNFMPIICFLG